MTQQFVIPGNKGSDVGKPLAEASDSSLNWWVETISKNLATNSSKYPDRDRAWLAAAQAEQARRKGGGQPAQGQPAPQRQAPPPQRQQAPASTALARAPQTQIVAGHFADPKSVNAMLESAMAQANLVAPATVCGSLPEGCEVAVSLVGLDLSKQGNTYSSGDVYSVGGKLGLSKSVLDRIAAAAAITWDASRCRRLDDGSDPRYCLFQAVGFIRNFDGTVREISGTKEMDLRDESAQVEALYERAKGTRSDGSPRSDPTNQIREMRLHIMGHAETKAKLRAIRSIGVKSAYTEAELKKPFAVARMTWTGRTDDPELRRVFAEKTADAMLGSMTALYGQSQPAALLPPQRVAPPQLPSRHVEDDDMDYYTDYTPSYGPPADQPSMAQPTTQPQPAQPAAASTSEKVEGLPADQDRGDNPDNY